MPNSPHNGRKQFLEEQRIKGAAFFDLDHVALPGSKYPHMLPPQSVYTQEMSKLGIKNSDTVVVYDKSGIFSGPRVAWNLSLYGHKKVYLLDNYLTYKKAEYPLDNTPVTDVGVPGASNSSYSGLADEEFKIKYSQQVIEYEELLELVKSGQLAQDYFVFDARSKRRFDGTDPEPRPGLSSGHVPSAISLPFGKVLNEDKTYKSAEELEVLLQSEYGIDLTKPHDKKGIIVMCGTGVSAVILKLALEIVLGTKLPVRVYDGSWTEWAQRAPSEFIEKS
jgi:thiosulfate/3-mercaptopyruvate sulfurtransferase